MNKFLGIISFPVWWIAMYLYRIVWFDLIGGIIDIFVALFTANFLLAFLYLLILPVSLALDIFIAIPVTFIFALGTSKDIMEGEVSIEDRFSGLAKKQR